MSIERIIQETCDRNPVGLKEALDEELKRRIGLALEAKRNEECDSDDEDDDEDYEDDDDESDE